MKNILSLILILFCIANPAFAQKKQTYKQNGTTYVKDEYYKSTNMPKVQRDPSAKKEFLKSRGLEKAPQNYQVDHVVPLSQGGADRPSNMQLLTKDQHRQKTARERALNKPISSQYKYKPMKIK